MSGAWQHFVTRGAPPTGACLVLVRHGEARCNVDGVVGGARGDGSLTARGRDQVRALRDRLARSGEFDDVSAFYTSTLPRAVETAALLAPALPPGLTPVSDDDLCELRPGAADGLTWDEVAQRYGSLAWREDPRAPFAPGGESRLEFFERCARALARLAERHPGQRVLVVSHGGVIEQAMKILYGEDPAARLGLRTDNASVTEIEFDGPRRRLLRYNDVAPLDAPYPRRNSAT